MVPSDFQAASQTNMRTEWLWPVVLLQQAFGQPTLAPTAGSVSLPIDLDVPVPTSQPRECGATLGIVTADIVKLAGRRVLERFLSGDLLERSIDIIFRPVVNNFRVIKVCASCEDHHDWYFSRGGKNFPGFHATYCDVDTVGYSVQHSALAFLPLDENTGELPDLLRLRTFVSMAPQHADVKMAPSEAFPMEDALRDMLSSNETVSTDFLTTYLPAMVAASAGSSALMPDPAGSGASENLVHRTMFHSRNYDRITAVSYLALERYLFDTTNQCTLLDKTVTVHGTDDGAFAALYATQILQRFKVNALTTFVQAGPLHLEKWLHQLVTTDFSSSETANEWMQLTALTYSSEIPFVRNTNSGTYLASETWRAPLIQAYGPNSTDRTVNFPNNPAELLNQELQEFFKSPSATCVDRPASLLCAVVLEASAYPVMLGQTDRSWAYPLNTCFSAADELLGLAQIEDTDLMNDVNLQQLWEQYTGPKGGFEGLSISKATDHESTLLLCSIAPTLFYTLQRHRPDDPENWPQRQVSMNSVEREQCRLLRKEPVPSPVSGGGGAVEQPTIADAPSLQVEPTAPTAPTLGNSPAGASTSSPDSSPIDNSSPTNVDSPTDSAPSSGATMISGLLSILLLTWVGWV